VASRMSGPSSGSVSFDRAVDYYDATRGMTPEAQAAVGDLLARELAGAGRCLEIGIGTGRIALPVNARGVDVFGIDLSEPMVRRLREKGDAEGAHVPVAVADATMLPFPEAAFGGALVAHVLHLIPEWRAALRELVRVVRPGGVALIALGTESGIRDEIETLFVVEAGIERAFIGLDHDPDRLDAAMRDLGAEVQVLPAVRQVKPTRLDEFISRLEDGLYSFTWRAEPEARHRAADAVRAWARERYGSLEEPRPFESAIVWRRYRLAG